jgi:hypothetical protein
MGDCEFPSYSLLSVRMQDCPTTRSIPERIDFIATIITLAKNVIECLQNIYFYKNELTETINICKVG